MGCVSVSARSVPAKAILVFAFIASLCWAQGSVAQNDARSSGTLVLAAVANHRCFAATIRATGAVVPKAVAIAAVESPNLRLDQLLVKEGDTVTPGQKLARLLRLSSGTPDRAATGALPGNPDRAAANATPEFFLYAPAAGRILKIAGAVGSTVSDQAEPLVQIALKDEFELQAQVPAVQVPKLKAGQRARIDFGGGQDMLGRLRLAPREVNRITQLGEARITLEGSEFPPPGTLAHVSIDAQRHCGVAVPRSAILEQSEITSVQVIRDNIVTTRQIRLGLLSEEAAEVVDGLLQGEVVVAHAGTSLHNGDQVKPSIVETRP